MAKVSTVIPVHNGEATIARAIESALAQDFDGVEVVAVDDGSTDSTPAILEGYGSRIKVVMQPNRGPAAARNAGVAASGGEYIAFLDADDVWLPGYLAKTCAALDANPKAVLAFTDIIAVDEAGARIDLPPVGCAPSMDDLMRRGSRITPSAAVMRRSAFDLCGGFCEEFRRPSHEDPWMWLLAREHGEFEYVAEPLVIYRVPDFVGRADKYDPGRRIFVRLVRERYGNSARGLLDAMASDFASGLVQKALRQMDSGDRSGAIRSWLRAARLKPSYFFDSRHAWRILRPRNLRRLFRLFAAAPRHAG